MIKKYRRLKALLCLLLGLLPGLVGCNRTTTSEEFVGPIPVSEFNKVPPPTFQGLIQAYDTVVGTDRTILKDEKALATALFNEVKRQQGNLSTQGALDLLARLSWEEWKLALNSPVMTWLSRNAVGPAANAGPTLFPCDKEFGFEDSKADAVRHAYWSALIAKKIYEDPDDDYTLEEALKFSEEFTTAHESNSEAKPKAMDLSNNAAGRSVYAENTKATDEQLLQLIASLPFEYAESETITFDDKRLVYFKGATPLDGKYRGTLTNPDSVGGPWSATFDVSRCGDVIRGSYTITRSSNLQKRRFAGQIVNGEIQLSITAPFQYENPTGASFCRDMTARLTSSGPTLSGNWSSSNCRQGGVISVSK